MGINRIETFRAAKSLPAYSYSLSYHCTDFDATFITP